MLHLDRRVCGQGDAEDDLAPPNQGRKATGGNHCSATANDKLCVGEHGSRQGQRMHPDL